MRILTNLWNCSLTICTFDHLYGEIANASDRIHACGGGHAAVLRDETAGYQRDPKRWQNIRRIRDEYDICNIQVSEMALLLVFQAGAVAKLPTLPGESCKKLLPFNSTLIWWDAKHGAFNEAWYFSKPLRSSVLTQKQDCNQKRIPASHKINHFVIIFHDFRHIKIKSEFKCLEGNRLQTCAYQNVKNRAWIDSKDVPLPMTHKLIWKVKRRVNKNEFHPSFRDIGG